MSTENTAPGDFPVTDENVLPTDERYAELLDGNDPLRDLRHEFWVPYKKGLKKTTKGTFKN